MKLLEQIRSKFILNLEKEESGIKQLVNQNEEATLFMRSLFVELKKEQKRKEIKTNLLFEKYVKEFQRMNIDCFVPLTNIPIQSQFESILLCLNDEVAYQEFLAYLIEENFDTIYIDMIILHYINAENGKHLEERMLEIQNHPFVNGTSREGDIHTVSTGNQVYTWKNLNCEKAQINKNDSLKENDCYRMMMLRPDLQFKITIVSYGLYQYLHSFYVCNKTHHVFDVNDNMIIDLNNYETLHNLRYIYSLRNSEALKKIGDIQRNDCPSMNQIINLCLYLEYENYQKSLINQQQYQRILTTL